MASTKRELAGKIVVITGASRGIGRATAHELARAGGSVVLASRSADALDAVAAEIRARGGTALTCPTDVTDQTQVARLIETTLAALGRIDIVVANAGQYVRQRVPELTFAELERSMAVNFYGAVGTCLAVLPSMLTRRSGHLIVVSSMDGRKGLPLDAPYVTAKFALNGFADVARQELRPYGIAVTSIMPGRVATDLIAGLRFHPISRPISAATVARAIRRAIARRSAEVVVPTQARVLGYAAAVSPAFADWGVRFFRLEGWTEDEGR